MTSQFESAVTSVSNVDSVNDFMSKETPHL